MLKWFVRNVIGGKSGKREAAWAVFTLWCIAFGFAFRAEYVGKDITNIINLLTVALPFAVGFLAVAHGMEWWGGRFQQGTTKE